MSNATGTLPTFLNHPRLLPKCDELSRPTPNRLVVSSACAREVGRQGNHFFYMPVGVVPQFDAKWEIIVAPAHFSL